MATTPIRVGLEGDLAGFHVLLDPEELTFGLLEDLQSGQITPIIDALTTAICGGDVPKLATSNSTGTPEGDRKFRRAGIRRLKAGEMKALIEGVGAAFAVPKS